MTTMRYVAFLRGMNLGGRRITNDELVDACSGLGLANVKAFLASGNVVFDATPRSEEALQARIEAGLGEALGYAVPTFVRSAGRVRAIAEHQPFPEEAFERSDGKLQVALLPQEPESVARDRVLAHASVDDQLAFEGCELYWLPKGPTTESDLHLATIEKAVGPWTMRTRRTIERLAQKFLQPQ